MSATDRIAFQMKLLFDPDVREAFLEDRPGTLHNELPDPADHAAFAAVDAEGLRLDADARSDYLMGALCRSFPLTCGGIGSYPGGARALSRFMASPHMFGAVADRTKAFGGHLSRLLELGVLEIPPHSVELLKALLELEQGLVDNAARIRADFRAGKPVLSPDPPSGNKLKRDPLALAPYLVVAHMPLPMELIKAAMGRPAPEALWTRIRTGQLSAGRFEAVSRADRDEVTLLARGIVTGHSVDRAGAGGAAPLVGVKHNTLELAGRATPLLELLDGKRSLKEIPGDAWGLVKSLAQAGFVVSVDD